ncbi:MAG: hypothetical protein K9M84_03555 [Spirochaetia bacterium]|nr:hypothetical protein [Spirochaetia bacterium]
MARIKSAFEIAMERVEDIDSDPEQLHRDELEKQGKRIAGTFIHDYDKTIEDASRDFEQIGEPDRPVVRASMIETIIANINLPQNDGYVPLLGKIKALILLLSGEDEGVMDLMVQIDNLYGQYLGTKDNLRERLAEQYRPQLMQKQQMLEQQTGQRIDLQPEQDKDFLDLLYQSYQRLDAQFNQVLDQLRDEIRKTMN